MRLAKPPDGSVQLTTGCCELDGDYYVVESYRTCECWKMHCQGCKTYYYWEKEPYKRIDCPICGALNSVEPRHHYWKTNDPKDNMVGVYEDHGWLPTCTSCGTRGYYRLGIDTKPPEVDITKNS